jgi:uncharacterized protein involved in exopolysaccharide biosynthesis
MTTSNPDQEFSEPEPVSMLEFATFLLRRRWLIVGCAAALFVAVVLVLSFGRTQYTSSAAFVPESSQQTSALAAVAAQFGAPNIGSDPSQSPAFYSDLLRSREVLSNIVQGDYRFRSDTGVVSGKLIDLLDVTAPTSGLRMIKAIAKLNRSMRVELKPRTGVISLQVRMPNPELAQQVVQHFLDELNRFNLEQRQSRAGAERKFTDGRLAQLQSERRAAEDQLQAFLQRNRDYRNSPELVFQYDRMAREVEFRKNVYTTVAQSNEKARIDEARDTPVITVVERPSLPARPDGRGRTKYGLLAIIVGALAGIGIGVARDALDRRRAASDPEFEAFSTAAEQTRDDFARILRFGRKRRRRGVTSS